MKETAEEYLKRMVAAGAIPTDPIRAGERINFAPNSIKLRQYKGVETPKNIKISWP